MKSVPGTLQAGGASFATTHWSVVAACRDGDAGRKEAEAALEQLCRDYWPPLYTFVRRRGYSSSDAQDLVQGFFTHFLKDRVYAQSQSEKGKFRTFLLAALKNYLSDAYAKERALKRGGQHRFVAFDEGVAAVEQHYNIGEAAMKPDAEWHYEQRWATTLVARALAGVCKEFRGDARVFEKLQPFVRGGAHVPRQDEVARELQMPIETLRSHLSRLRARYRACLREEVARTIGSADDVDEELQHLSRILIAAA